MKKGRFSDPTIFESMVDWDNSRVLCTPHGLLYILSHVKEEDKRHIVTELKERLAEIVDPDTGTPVIRKIHQREEIYSGEYLSLAPDLILEWERGYYLREGKILNRKIFASPSDTLVNNDQHGIFLAWGPDITPGREIQHLSIYDIAPTTLHMMNTPIPFDMDGSVVKEIFKEDSEPSQREVTYESKKDIGKYEATPEDVARTVEKLRLLGYME